ncbi:aldo/keto reductase [Methanomassiliicoccus luminyensis]|uniref:aldo/keto reductase n=1 Tax=Methanomassiliicoccus luminyensis TaxID=1080712 RepID=UPI00038138FA|nr:aldo/keto reductase [Methanomassiliicoccus luminyensis]
MASLSLTSTVELSNGVRMPSLGVGVFKVPNREAYQNVLDALDLGYRHIDTAAYYQNEDAVGRAVANSGVPREDVFITTKVWNSDQGYDEALAAFDRSLELLRTDYVDLYLIHWPKSDKRLETWRALEKLLDDGRARAIGVSNYLIRHLDEVIANSEVVPMVDQVEFSPFLYQKELLEYCRSNNIVLEAYSPLTRGKKLGDPRVVAVAERYGRTAAQVMIRWVLQKGMVAIPKSVHRERLAENAAVFDFTISEGDMAELDSLNEDYHTTWNPSDIP